MEQFEKFVPPPDETPVEPARPGGDRRDGLGYVYHDPKIALAVNVALATFRPLLIFGPSGSGKSSLAPSVARILRRRYYEQVITSRTQARDLLWQFDTLRRLSDAEAGRLDPDDRSKEQVARYITPGVLWWALDPASARLRGLDVA